MSDIAGGAPGAITSMISVAQNRGDMMVVFDSSKYNTPISTVLTNTSGYDTSYAATYWPWVKTIDPNTANQVWVPASVVVPGVYAFNDNVSAPWFAPAGVNRGVLTTAVQAERVLTQGNRDTLYQANINPIATFPNTGVVVFGQKTLQKKASSLDRIKKVHLEWVKPGHRTGNNTHNVSATVSLKEDEWDLAGEWMWENRDHYNGLSVLPYDGGTYTQAPFEDITEERYEELMQSLHNIDLTQVIELDDNTDLSGELACAGGACEVK